MIISLRLNIFYFLIFFLSGRISLSAQEGGYVFPLSAGLEDTVCFYISTADTQYDLTIYKIDTGQRLIQTFTLNGGIKTTADSSYQYGCDWPVSLALKIP